MCIVGCLSPRRTTQCYLTRFITDTFPLELQCYLPSPSSQRGQSSRPQETIQIASFVPPPLDASPPLPEATLTIFPYGHKLIDEIVVSALVIERMLTR
ncbi:hypothetical protein BDZ97DRAFT_1782813 [Flammula alnicola]|nr:hypothetical protein BDZ97DRAFT_1782813 [Flammula alnicola]